MAMNSIPLPGDEPRRLLLAASTGGHLTQLHRFAPLLGAGADSLWVTFKSPQSESLLQGRDVLWVPYIAPRDLGAVRQAVHLLRKEVAPHSFDAAVSTGAGLALAALPTARMKGIPGFYIESVSRLNGPSLSGRILAATRLFRTYTQHDSWASKRWKPVPPVLAAFESDEAREHASARRLFVTLGTIRPYRFDALVDAVLGTGLGSDSTTWQLGCTTRDDLPGTVHSQMSASDFYEQAIGADVVITHAGVGTILQLLEWGIFPVVVPRTSASREHVDDHQWQIADLIARLRLGEVSKPQDLTAEHLLRASRFRIRGR